MLSATITNWWASWRRAASYSTCPGSILANLVRRQSTGPPPRPLHAWLHSMNWDEGPLTLASTKQWLNMWHQEQAAHRRANIDPSRRGPVTLPGKLSTYHQFGRRLLRDFKSATELMIG